MSKVKMRCTTCGKWFQSANAKEVTCPDCVQKARKEKLAQKNMPPGANKTAGTLTSGGAPRTVAPPPKPKQPQSTTSHWYDSLQDVKVAQPEPPPQRPKISPPPQQRDNRGGAPNQHPATSGPNQREDRSSTQSPPRESGLRDRDRSATSLRFGNTPPYPGTFGQRPRQPMEEARGPRPDKPQRPSGPHNQVRSAGGGNKFKGKPKTPRSAPPPKPRREKIPPPAPFVPTPEQIAQVEARYLELATPTEYDGIRTQISKEQNIPKKAIKKIVKDLRDRMQIPSWWETQTYKGTPEELERIKAAYIPLLPVPPVGIHKKIADELDMKSGQVYQAIKTIRLEMNLPQYNDPTYHEEELAALRQAREEQARLREERKAVQHTEQTPSPALVSTQQAQAPEPTPEIKADQPIDAQNAATDQPAATTQESAQPEVVSVSSSTDETAAE